MTLNLEEIHTFAAQLAIEAGSFLWEQALERASASSSNEYDIGLAIKENAADLVTKADRHAELLISNAIARRFPSHKYLIFIHIYRRFSVAFVHLYL